MTLVDYIVILILAISIFYSVIRGFVREVLSLVSWIGAIYIAINFTPWLELKLPETVSHPGVRYGTAFVVILVLTVFGFSFIASQLSRFVKHTGLSGTDRLLGVFFGLARGLLIVTIAAVAVGFSPLVNEDFWENALFRSELERASLLFNWVPDELIERTSASE